MPQYTKTILEEELRRGERLPVGWPWRLFVFTLVLLALAFLIYLGLDFGYKAYLNKSIDGLNSTLNSLSFQVAPTEREGFITFYSQLSNLQKLLASHIISSKVFPVLEGLTDQRVAYSTLNVSVVDRTVTVDGVAKDYAALASQLAIYEQSPEIERVILENSALANKVVKFTAKLTLKNETFHL
jgi:hypothetical protein